MSTNLENALKKDYNEYKKQMLALEKDLQAVEKKMEALDNKYEQVLDLMGIKPRMAKVAPKRAKRGQSRTLILDAIKRAKKPLRAYEIIEAILANGDKLSNASVRQQLPKMVDEGILKKDKGKTYAIK